MKTYIFCFTALFAAPALASPLVTGNGLGFAVFSPEEQAVTSFYAHPYRFEKPNPNDLNDDGFLTTNFVRQLNWKENSRQPASLRAAYVNESHVIRAEGEGFRQDFYQPFGLAQNALVVSALGTRASASCLNIQWRSSVRARQKRNVQGREVTVFSFGTKEKVALIPLEARRRAEPLASCFSGSTTWALVSLDGKTLDQAVAELNRWQNGLTGAALSEREVAEHEAWRVASPSLAGAEKNLWRQSETILRMSQIREQNRPGRYNHGLILASLPNGNWFIPWVRDMSYAVVALIRMGHQGEARKAVDSLLQARSVGRMRKQVNGYDYQISTVRYFGDGSEEADRSGQAIANIEYDSWGLALWVMGEYFDKYKDYAWLKSSTYRGPAYLNIRDFIVKPLIGNLEPFGDGMIVRADTSIWEQNFAGGMMHYAFSTIAAINGLERFLPLAEAEGDAETIKKVESAIQKLRIGFQAAYVKEGRMWGTVEGNPANEIDGAVLEAINFGVMQDPAVIQNTHEASAALLTASGGYRRVLGATPYEEQEFLFINYSIARNWLRLGEVEKADSLVAHMTEKSALDHNFIPEMYVSKIQNEFPGAIGAPTGSIPMVGYGAGLNVIYQLERNAAAR